MSEQGTLDSNRVAGRASVMSGADALRARDFDRLMQHYADDVVVFDVPPPARKTGKKRYRGDWEKWLGEFDGAIDIEFKDMQVEADDGVAFVNTLSRVFLQSDETSDHWARVTVGLKKIDGHWLAVHEHVSLPAGSIGYIV